MKILRAYLDARSGRIKELAAVLDITPSAVSMWKRVPAERVLLVEKHTGLRRELLRPDLYPETRHKKSA